jgi:phospholipid-binding lipoprotein MlaA
VSAQRRQAAAAALAAALLLGGCATTGPATPGDPWEGFNRKVFAFNEAVDGTVLRPVAETYRDVAPALVRKGVSNFLSNLGDLRSAANHLLQGKGASGLEQGMRFLTNTLFGLGGLLDPASEMGMTRKVEDFGQTLGRWGIGPGPYLVLPLLGPSSVRDGIGRVPEVAVSVAALVDDRRFNTVTTVLDVVDTRWTSTASSARPTFRGAATRCTTARRRPRCSRTSATTRRPPHGPPRRRRRARPPDEVCTARWTRALNAHESSFCPPTGRPNLKGTP